MTEGEFIRYYKKKNKEKSLKEVKKKIDLFWKALLKGLEKEKKVTFKDWGMFEKKEVKSRKVSLPRNNKIIHTEPKSVIKFKVGVGLKDIINGAGFDE